MAGNPHAPFSYWAPGNSSVTIGDVAESDHTLPTMEHV
jgi:hypothetical protein